MKAYIRQSIKITVSVIGLALLLASVSTITLLERTGYPVLRAVPASVIAAITVISYMAYVIVYGRLAEAIQGRTSGSFLSLLKEHALNFIVIGILLTLPALFLVFIVSRIYPSPEDWKLLYLVSSGLVNIITLYVMPYVFVLKQRLSAIKNGIKFFFSHLRLSVPLIISEGAILVIYQMGFLGLFDNVYATIVLLFALTFLSVFVNFVLFTLAGLILREHGEFKQAMMEFELVIDS